MKDDAMIYAGAGIGALAFVYYLNRSSSGVSSPAPVAGDSGVASPPPDDSGVPSPANLWLGGSFLKPHHVSTGVPMNTPHDDDAFDISVLSGRFDGPKDGVRQDWARERDAGSSILLGTELAHRATDVISGPGYGVIHMGPGARGENALSYKKADWTVISAHVKQVLAGGGERRLSEPSYALVSVLQNRHNGQYFIDVQNHDPAHLFRTSKFYDPRNVMLWRKAMRAQAAVIHDLQAKYPGAAFALSGDLNAGGVWLSRFMKTTLPGFHPGHGFTYGNVWYKNLETNGPATHHAAQGSDHPVYRLPFRYPDTHHNRKSS